MNTENSLAQIVEANPVVVLTDSAKFSRFYEDMRQEVDAHVPDLTTASGRKAIASLAYKIARTKTAIDDAGKQLNEAARDQIAKVDAARRDIRDQLDDLRDKARRPLTEWEVADKARIDKCAGIVRDLIAMSNGIAIGDTAQIVSERLTIVNQIVIDEAEFQEQFGVANLHHRSAINILTANYNRLLKEEADYAELETLRKEAAERADRERQEAEAAAAAVRAKQDAEADAARVAAIILEAEAAALIRAETEAARQRDEAARVHAKQLADETARADKAEAERKNAAIQAAREIEEKAAATAKREADIKHRAKITSQIMSSLMEACQIDDVIAQRVTTALAGNLIPNISIQF